MLLTGDKKKAIAAFREVAKREPKHHGALQELKKLGASPKESIIDKIINPFRNRG